MRGKKRLTPEAAAQKLADMTQAYLRKLSPEEKRARLRAFRKAISEFAESRPKSAGASRAPSIPLAARGHGGR